MKIKIHELKDKEKSEINEGYFFIFRLKEFIYIYFIFETEF